MNTKSIGASVVLVLVGGGAFYAGMSSGANNAAATNTARGGQFGAAGGFGTGAGMMGGTRTGRSGAGGGFASGQIVTSDPNSVTIKLASGSTQIVLVNTTTQVLKSVAGSLANLAAGTEVVVSGSTNSDGSLTAQSIQIRPAGIKNK